MMVFWRMKKTQQKTDKNAESEQRRERMMRKAVYEFSVSKYKLLKLDGELPKTDYTCFVIDGIRYKPALFMMHRTVLRLSQRSLF